MTARRHDISRTEPETSCAGTLAITPVNGRQVVVPVRIDPALLARLLPVLDGT